MSRIRLTLAVFTLCASLCCEQVIAQGGFGADWDWGAIEAIDDTPVTSKDVVVKQIDASRRLSVDEVTAPDMDAIPHRAYALFKDMPDFKVIPSVRDAELYPCANCHQNVTSDTTVRDLKEPHEKLLLRHGLHGKGQFWCFTCHDKDSAGRLKTLKGDAVSFEDAYIVCGQCHVRQARDWGYGAHGKRVANWSGQRQVYNCTVCHYQHAPAIAQRDAMSGPTIRQGLDRPGHWHPVARGGSLHIPPPPWRESANSEEGHE